MLRYPQPGRLRHLLDKNLFAPTRCLVKFPVVTELLRKKISALPHKPGIYLMRDRFGTVIYVGKARNLRKRVSQYFQKGRRIAPALFSARNSV